MTDLFKKVDVPEGVSGPWTVERFEVSDQDARFSRLRAACGHGRELVRAGSYTRLMRDLTVVMSDTQTEIRDHVAPVYNATGCVLLAGLGLGVVLDAILCKPEVDHVTVVEKSADVIVLIGPHYQERFGDRLTIVNADVFEFKPEKGKHWDVAWFDIWDEICSDNLPEITNLKRLYPRRRAAWRGFWCEREMRAAKWRRQ